MTMNSNQFRFPSASHPAAMKRSSVLLCYTKTVPRMRQVNYRPGRPPDLSLRTQVILLIKAMSSGGLTWYNVLQQAILKLTKA